ncbi:MAG: pyrroloquinoline quinone biosynthesis peptide chaperone PqqD [Burkholderiaceae bacterium]
MSQEDAPAVSGDAIPSIAAGFRLQFEKAQDSWVLLYPEGMVKLNQSAGEILQRCDGKRNVTQLIEVLEQAFDETGLTDDIKSFMAIALRQQWITLD